SAPAAAPPIWGGTLSRVRVTFGEITAPPPRPPTSRGSAAIHPAQAAGAMESTTAVAANPTAVLTRPTTVNRRPYLVTNRPATAADNAEPSANGVTASPDCSGV